MRSPKKILDFLREHELEKEVFESMGSYERNAYSEHIRTSHKKLLPSAWLEKRYAAAPSFSQIARALGISRTDAVNAYKSAMQKLQAHFGVDSEISESKRAFSESKKPKKQIPSFELGVNYDIDKNGQMYFIF